MAKITIQKKTDINPFKEISQTLNFNQADLEARFPRQYMEPWRRFDPERLLSSMRESSRNGIGSPVVTGAGLTPEILTLASSAEWKKSNEIFHKKVEKNLGLFRKHPEGDFFEAYLKESIQPEAFHILRIAGFETPDSAVNETATIAIPTPTIEISPDNQNQFNRHILYIYCEEKSRSTLNIVKKSGLFDLSAIYIFQEKNSILRLRYLDENLDTNCHGVNFIKSYQEKNSLCEIGIYNTCRKQNKKVFVENVLMENANARYSGIFAGKYSHVDHDFNIEHDGSYSKSDVLFKMAVLDEAYGIFWGDTKIIPGTRGCEGYQQNKNMILGENARVDAIPRLRIQTEHVMAAHGSATGEISDDEIFYMMSRGLSELEARKLLLRGFFEDVLRQSFGADPDISNTFLARIWSNIEKILGTTLSGHEEKI